MLECPVYVTGNKYVRMSTDIYGKQLAMEQKEHLIYGDMFYWRGVDFIQYGSS
jgi:hypothetical protein